MFLRRSFRFATRLTFAICLLGQTAFATLTLDQNFRAPFLSIVVPPARALALPDGKFVLYFSPDTLTDERVGAITRYQANGAFDPSFNFTRDYQYVSAAAALPNGQLLVAAAQREYDNTYLTER